MAFIGKNKRGATLIESLITFSLFSITAISIFPILFMSTRASKLGNLKQLCQNVVRTKLEQYRGGYIVAQPQDGSRLANLSVGNMSNSTIDTANNQVVAGGFFYAKYRYNQFYPFSCRGTSQASIFTAPPPGYAARGPQTYGMRECVGTTTAWDDTLAPQACPSPLDSSVGNEIPGFKLYVQLQLATSWPYAMTGDVGASVRDEQYDPMCPNDGAYGAPNWGAPPDTTNDLYDFTGAGDAIRVTVRGVMDITSTGNNQLAGISDPNALECSATTVLYPQRYPARYYLTQIGRIYRIQGRGMNRSEARWTYESLYNQAGAMTSGIISFAVHPRNFSLYILRNGTLIRYSKCGGVPIDCDHTIEDETGISDTGEVGWASVQEWTVPQSIRHIGIDFRSGTVYGMSGNAEDFYTLTFNNLPLRDCNADCKMGANPTPVVELNTVAAGAFPRPVAGTVSPNVTGFFIVPDGDEAFVSAMSQRMFFGSSLYQSAIYRINDVFLQYPVSTMPLAAKSYSK